ncbi:hypothetical protein [Marinobacter sp.]|uniref:hypothetical protein n=1 Tax=Marinobacter sp. TaxID=50741 RepID=UPI002353F804|nr:hypothetical protein [Marinobacter sp.]|tara:strand:- start:321 stop:590 length:270 start_codon:yes stop_codon:yes gene_type:complete
MKTTERVLNALQRVKELLSLISDWTKQPKEEDLLTKEFREKKLKMIEDLYKQLGELNDRYMFNHNSEFATKEYIVQYDELKKKIYDLEK